jgi:hypothetical protein
MTDVASAFCEKRTQEKATQKRREYRLKEEEKQENSLFTTDITDI